MKKIMIFCLIIVFTFIVSLNILAEENKYTNVITSEYAQMKQISWENKTKNPGNINERLNTPEKLLKEVDQHIEEICKYLGIEDKLDIFNNNKISIDFTDGISTGRSNGILLYKTNFRDGFAPVVHELTHYIAPLSYSRSLSEGLACFMQDKFGKNGAPPNAGYPIFPLSKELIRENQKIIAVVGKKGDSVYFNKIMDKERSAAYNLSYSFTKYLIQEYGIDKFLKIYDKEDLYQMYQQVYGKNLEELKADWLEFIKDTEPFNYTLEEWLKKLIKES